MKEKMKTKMQRWVSLLVAGTVIAGMLTGCGESAPAEAPASETSVEDRAYTACSSNDTVTQVGMDIMAAGGNAVDAAIAMSYALSVIEPHSNGLGGSGGMLVYDMNEEECRILDYRACAGSVSEAGSTDKVAVPGFVAGMELAHKTYGSMDMAELMQPAIDYAENGFEVYYDLRKRFVEFKGDMSHLENFMNSKGETLVEGDILVQKELAETLRAIQKDGADVFYHGYIADDIAAATTLEKKDLENYKTHKRKALMGSYRGGKVYSAKGPYCGLILIQMLKMADINGMPNYDEDPLGYLEKLKLYTYAAQQDRARKIIDHDFYDVDEQKLTGKTHIKKLTEKMAEKKGIELEDYVEECVETTSFTVMDSNGLCVSCTNTLSNFWGSGIYVDGMFMNNSNTNFSAKGNNAYEPGKRSRTYMAPAIVVREDGSVFAIGTPGGDKIPNILFQVIEDIVKNGMDPQEAVTKSRIIYGPDFLTVETKTVESRESDWLDTSNVAEQVVWVREGFYWGSVSISGYSPEKGAFGAYDWRRGATKIGLHNVE